MARKKSPFVYAKQSIVIAVDASPVEYARRKVYDRRKQEHVEIPITAEIPPVKEEQVGTHYVFASGERVPYDHPAVLAKPSAFMDVAPDDELALA